MEINIVSVKNIQEVNVCIKLENPFLLGMHKPFIKREKKINKNSLEIQKNPAIPNDAGIYFLFNSKNQLVYIGQSIRLKNRIFSHASVSHKYKHTKKIIFDKCSFVKVSDGEKIRLMYEAFYVMVYKPVYNCGEFLGLKNNPDKFIYWQREKIIR